MIGFREFVILVIVKLRLLVKYGNSKGSFIKIFLLLNRKKVESKIKLIAIKNSF